MAEADGWYMCRVGFVETFRAVGLAAGGAATRGLKREWPAFGIVEVDQSLVERAAALAVDSDLRSLDALHLAAALLLPGEDRTSWAVDTVIASPAGPRPELFATHGVADEKEPAHSGLWLAAAGSASPGFLSVGDILGLRLNAELVTLSACETGLGKLERGEGVLGLTRAFLAAVPH